VLCPDPVSPCARSVTSCDWPKARDSPAARWARSSDRAVGTHHSPRTNNASRPTPPPLRFPGGGGRRVVPSRKGRGAENGGHPGNGGEGGAGAGLGRKSRSIALPPIGTFGLEDRRARAFGNDGRMDQGKRTVPPCQGSELIASFSISNRLVNPPRRTVAKCRARPSVRARLWPRTRCRNPLPGL
jgi:hypothetical protein